MTIPPICQFLDYKKDKNAYLSVLTSISEPFWSLSINLSKKRTMFKHALYQVNKGEIGRKMEILPERKWHSVWDLS
jgi:hypothetical protein